MSTIVTHVNFGSLGYQDDLIESMAKGMVGKPFYDQERKPIGTITKANLVVGTRTIEVEVGLDEGTDGGVVFASRQISVSAHGWIERKI